MSLRSIPLRLKLVAALVLPMLVVAGYLGVSIRNSIEQRSDAFAAQTEVNRFVAIASLSDAIGVENLVIFDTETDEAGLAQARSSTDAVMDLLRSPELDLGDANLAVIEQRYAQLRELRSTIGDRPFEIRLTAQSELRSGELTMTGEITPALEALSELPATVLADFDVSVETTTTTSALLDDYFLLQRYRADLAREVTTLVRVASLPANLIDSTAVEAVGISIASTDQSEQTLRDLGTSDLLSSVGPILEGAPAAQYQGVRTVIDASGPGQRPDVDTDDLQSTASRLDIALDGAGNATIASLAIESDDSVVAANRSLILSGLIGLWLLILVGIVLRVLYRAIKSPIERLTEHAHQIALIELPEIVSQMRRGEIDELPQVAEIVAESDDEIGELVHAFNNMHRTAVELAAEQANSRRVVADMFVNLGRRNQRLVNRLLKGLTVLEQHEEDPDKLASLYEIDHVATRMRRNAESLLVLAGSGQSRRWDQPVPMYDIARASLAEVENYERVQIDASDTARVDGGVVADLTHLLAELVENALSFSPPSSPVEIVARNADGGLVIAVSDHGVGMSPERLAAANEQIMQAAGEDETPSEFLGHYVVGRLAVRHGIFVELLAGPAGGVTARVVLPSSAVAADESPQTGHPAYAPELAQPASSPSPAASMPTVSSPSPAVSPTPVASSLSEQSPRTPQPLAHTETSPAQAPSIESPLQPTLHPVAPVAPTVEPQPTMHFDPDPLDVIGLPLLPADPPVPAPSLADARPAPAAAPAPTVHDATPTAPNPATFEWPSPSEVDPLSIDHRTSSSSRPSIPASIPDAAPAGASPAAAVSTQDLNRAADDAVNGALSVFGSARRTPGAQLPETDLLASISGSMGLGASGSAPDRPSGLGAGTERPLPDLGDENQVRFDLSGFQQGINRADREHGGTTS